MRWLHFIIMMSPHVLLIIIGLIAIYSGRKDLPEYETPHARKLPHYEAEKEIIFEEGEMICTLRVSDEGNTMVKTCGAK